MEAIVEVIKDNNDTKKIMEILRQDARRQERNDELFFRLMEKNFAPQSSHRNLVLPNNNYVNRPGNYQ